MSDLDRLIRILLILFNENTITWWFILLIIIDILKLLAIIAIIKTPQRITYVSNGVDDVMESVDELNHSIKAGSIMLQDNLETLVESINDLKRTIENKK